MDKLLLNQKYLTNFNFLIPKDISDNFQAIFSYIKKKYQIKFSRKSHIDSLLKKCKGKFFKAIHEIINMSLNTIVKRLPQKFITNITIEYNKKFLDKNIILLYKEFGLLPDYNTLIEKGMIKIDRKKLFEEFCGYSLVDLYNIYRESERFRKEVNEVKNKDGKRNGILYEFVSKNFCAYYVYGKPHHILRQKKERDGEINKEKDLSNNSNNDTNISNITNNNNFNTNNNNFNSDVNYKKNNDFYEEAKKVIIKEKENDNNCNDSAKLHIEINNSDFYDENFENKNTRKTSCEIKDDNENFGFLIKKEFYK